MMVYLGASMPLRLVPRDAERPAFHVRDLAAEVAAVVQPQLKTPYCYYAGAFELCGCGFQLGEYPDDRDKDDQQGEKRAALAAFAAYLRTELRRHAEIRVLACWAGDEAKPPQHRRGLSPEALLGDDFYFLDGESSVVRSGHARCSPV